MDKYLKQYEISTLLTLYGAYWPSFKADANVLIVTGMEEHAFRYQDFAFFLNNEGFDVYSVDYYGQGENITYGGMVKQEVPVNAFELFVEHLGQIASDIKKDGKPLYILGHSMGSFLTQRFLQKFPGLASKAVVVGSNGPSILFGLGKCVACLTVTKKNRNKTSKLLASLSIGSYAKSIKNARTPADWLSYDEHNVDAFLNNPLNGGPSSKGFYQELLKGTNSLYKKKRFDAVDRDLPILFLAGQDDPVGGHGKGVIKLHKFYKKLGFNNVKLKLYPHMRHEILNETKKKEVFADVLKFLK
ncbi:MAG: alpha/beta hydrolase [Bacilli bacterium]